MTHTISTLKSFYPIPPNEIDKKRKPITNYKFKLNKSTKDELYSMKPEFGFGQFGRIVYYRTYSRKMKELTKKGKKHLLKLRKENTDRLKALLVQAVENNYTDYDTLDMELTRAHQVFEEEIFNKLTEGRDYFERQEQWADTII